MLDDIANIATLFGFLITIWQLVVMNNRLKNVEVETKRKYKATLDLLKARDILSLIHSIQDDLTLTDSRLLTSDRIKMVIVRMQYLYDYLIDTQDDELVKLYGRSDHQKLVLSVSSNINLLRDAYRDESFCLDTRFICENLQHLRDSIKLIETHLTK